MSTSKLTGSRNFKRSSFMREVLGSSLRSIQDSVAKKTRIVNLCEFRGLSGLSKRDCLGRTRRTKRATHAGQDIKDETLKVLHPNKKLDIIGSPFG